LYWHTADEWAIVLTGKARVCLKTGTWRDKIMLVLELRGAKGEGSINQKGNYQATLMELEVHVKDEARFPGKWAFFGFNGSKTAKMIPSSADWYSCHAAHICPVLSNSAADRYEQGHARRYIPEGDWNTAQK
jgi:hypothetical protein